MVSARSLKLGMLLAIVASLTLVGSANAWIYWGHSAPSFGVGRAGLDGTQHDENFVAPPPGVYGHSIGVAVDANHLYWGSEGLNTVSGGSPGLPVIGRSLLDGTSPEYSFTAATGQNISGLSTNGGYLYWSSNTLDTSELTRTPTVGGQPLETFTSLLQPASCGVASDGTYLYFANRNTYSIGRVKLSEYGSPNPNIEGQWIQLPDTPSESVSPCGIAVDDNFVYWGIYEVSGGGTSRPGTTIGRVPKSGAPNEVTDNFATSGNRVTGLAIDGSFIYTSNVGGEELPGRGSIGRANLSGGGADPSFISGLSFPWGVAVDGLGPGAPPPLPGPGVSAIPSLPVGCGGCGGTSHLPVDSTPPDFSRVWTTHPTFAPAPWSTPGYAVAKAASVAEGTIFNYILDKAGTVSIAITHATSGRHVGKHCLASSHRNARRPKCRRLLTVATLTRLSQAGHNEVPFSGRINGKALKPGSYTAVFTAKAPVGAATTSQSFSFKIVRP
jgi:hypothetical protein